MGFLRIKDSKKTPSLKGIDPEFYFMEMGMSSKYLDKSFLLFDKNHNTIVEINSSLKILMKTIEQID